MRAWLMDSAEGVERLRLREVVDPRPGPAQVLLRMRVAALNPADAFLARPFSEAAARFDLGGIVHAELVDGAWDATVRIRRILTDAPPHVKRVTCRKVTGELAERRAATCRRRLRLERGDLGLQAHHQIGKAACL